MFIFTMSFEVTTLFQRRPVAIAYRCTFIKGESLSWIEAKIRRGTVNLQSRNLSTHHIML